MNRDSDGSCGLSVAATHQGFAGEAIAYFNISEIADFAEKLAAYPLKASVELRGGYWHSSEPRIEQEHLYISAYPIGHAGEIGIRVRMSTPVTESDRPNSRHATELEFRTYYENLRSFSKNLRQLANGEAEEAILDEHEV